MALDQILGERQFPSKDGTLGRENVVTTCGVALDDPEVEVEKQLRKHSVVFET